MAPSLYSRIYSRLTDLIPAFSADCSSREMFAAPRQKDDLALFCAITSYGDGKVQVEIAYDATRGKVSNTHPWMTFSVDHRTATAELIGFIDESVYYKKAGPDGQIDRQRTGLNVYAVNWLSCFVNLHFQFAPTTPHFSFAAGVPADVA